MSTFWPVKTQHCGLWEDKKRAVYSDNETTNEQGYRVTHTHTRTKHVQTHTNTPAAVPEEQASARVRDHLC